MICSPARVQVTRDTGVTPAGECTTCEALAEVPSITSPCLKTHNDRALHLQSHSTSPPQSLALVEIILRWDIPGASRKPLVHSQLTGEVVSDVLRGAVSWPSSCRSSAVERDPAAPSAHPEKSPG